MERRKPEENLLNGSLVLGGPSLLAVVELLQITLHVEDLLLREKKKGGTFVENNDVLLSVSGAL